MAKKGYKHTDEARANMSAAAQARVQTPGGKAQIAALHTPEMNARKSAAMMGRAFSDEQKANLSAALMGNQNCLGRVVSKETRAKISDAHTGVELSEEHRAAISAARTGIILSEEARANMSDARKAYSQTEEGKAHLARMRAAINTGPTRLEKMLYRLLDSLTWEYDTEVSFTPYIVDAYIPGLHLALDTDGAFHFIGNPFTGTTPEQEAQKTKERDAYLLEAYDLRALHFTEEDLAFLLTEDD